MILGNVERVQELVKSIDINRMNDVGDTALIRASEFGKYILYRISGQSVLEFIK